MGFSLMPTRNADRMLVRRLLGRDVVFLGEDTEFLLSAARGSLSFGEIGDYRLELVEKRILIDLCFGVASSGERISLTLSSLWIRMLDVLSRGPWSVDDLFLVAPGFLESCPAKEDFQVTFLPKVAFGKPNRWVLSPIGEESASEGEKVSAFEFLARSFVAGVEKAADMIRRRVKDLVIVGFPVVEVKASSPEADLSQEALFHVRIPVWLGIPEEWRQCEVFSSKLAKV
jgi:hypothetical protein